MGGPVSDHWVGAAERPRSRGAKRLTEARFLLGLRAEENVSSRATVSELSPGQVQGERGMARIPPAPERPSAPRTPTKPPRQGPLRGPPLPLRFRL